MILPPTSEISHHHKVTWRCHQHHCHRLIVDNKIAGIFYLTSFDLGNEHHCNMNEFGTVASCNWAGVDDTNECESEPCDPNATCTDLHEDFKCECNEFYEGDGKTCTLIPDVNECELGTHNCSPDATCSDERIDYKCECVDGFKDSMQVFIYRRYIQTLYNIKT